MKPIHSHYSWYRIGVRVKKSRSSHNAWYMNRGKVNGVDVAVSVSHRSPLGAGYPNWDAAGPTLSVAPGELTLLAYEVRTKSEEVRGRHFVVLRRVVGNKIDVLDPVRPHKDTSYVLEH